MDKGYLDDRVIISEEVMRMTPEEVEAEIRRIEAEEAKENQA